MVIEKDSLDNILITLTHRDFHDVTILLKENEKKRERKTKTKNKNKTP